MSTESPNITVEDEVKESIKRIRSFPANPTISRRWSSCGLGEPPSELWKGLDPGSSVPRRRRTLQGTNTAADVLSAFRAKLTTRILSAHQQETPTMITLRRASAVLNTVAQRQVDELNGNWPLVAPGPDDWQNLHSKVPVAAYLISPDEISALEKLIKKTFADGTPCERSGADMEAQPERVIVKDNTGKKRGSEAGSRASTDKLARRGESPADVAVTVVDVHTVVKSPHHSRRRGSFVTQISRKSSIVSTMLSKKSIHEIIWQDDGSPASVRSSVWNISFDPKKNNLATWSSNSFRRDSDKVVVSFQRQLSSSSSRRASRALRKATMPLVFRPVWDSPPKRTSPPKTPTSRSLHGNFQSAQKNKETLDILPFPGKLAPAAMDEELAKGSEVEDVVSFPPLPQRHSTSDWLVPLPDINTPAAEVPVISLFAPSAHASLDASAGQEDKNGPQDLYSLGVDVTLPQSRTAPTTPQNKLNFWGREDGRAATDTARRQSSVHEALSRTAGTPSSGAVSPRNVEPAPVIKRTSNTKLGSALGISGSAKRKGSRVEHIRIMEAALQKPTSRHTWVKPRKDSGYPGAALPISSDEEDHTESEDDTRSHSHSRISGEGPSPNESSPERQPSFGPEALRGKSVVLQLPTALKEKAKEGVEKIKDLASKQWDDREAHRKEERTRMPKEQTPQPVKHDLAGIFHSMTGARKSDNAGSNCDETCQAHECGKTPEVEKRNPSVDWIG
jgi:hypothetical protein